MGLSLKKGLWNMNHKGRLQNIFLQRLPTYNCMIKLPLPKRRVACPTWVTFLTKDIPSKAIAYGVPAEVKGFLSDDEIKAYADSSIKWE